MKPTRINDKIAIARELYGRFGDALKADSRICLQLQELSERLKASDDFCLRSGVASSCRQCDLEEGGSCCGAGIEDRYTPELLLINLLLGVSLPESKNSEKSCHFLGEEGCILQARDILCVNYLCTRLNKTIPFQNLLQLQEVNGLEMDLLFRLHDMIRNFIRRNEK